MGRGADGEMSKGYKIGDACKELDVQPYVLRYWETEFPFLRPAKGSAGQRVYDERELGLIRRVKELLYDEGYTIAGAKKKLEAEIESGREHGVAAKPARPEAPQKRAQRSLVEDGDDAAAVPETIAADADEPAAAPEGNAAAGSLDTSSSEQIETIARGLRALREEARQILDLLDGGASSAAEKE
jgi:DNA-binding transcriptional MerR regulator